ncbi:MAG: Dabb family protein [Gemmatimonadaceae bacterium]
MFVHAVYFYLRDDLTSAEREKFAAGLRSLRAIDGVRDGYIGKPASTDRPVIERGYSASLVLVFDDQNAHDAYQTDVVHDRFRAECGGFWKTVRIYDSITEDDARVTSARTPRK